MNKKGNDDAIGEYYVNERWHNIPFGKTVQICNSYPLYPPEPYKQWTYLKVTLPPIIPTKIPLASVDLGDIDWSDIPPLCTSDEDIECNDGIQDIQQNEKNKINKINEINEINEINSIKQAKIQTITKRKLIDSTEVQNKRQKTNVILPLSSNQSTKYKFDLIYEECTAKKCIKQYDDLELPNHIHNNLHKQLKNTLTRVVENKLWNQDNNSFTHWDNTYRIGDVVIITYFPFSQKYIDYYNEQSFTGRIIFIDNDKSNVFFLINEDSNDIGFKSLQREGCHYMGMTQGYNYNIELVDLTLDLPIFA